MNREAATPQGGGGSDSLSEKECRRKVMAASIMEEENEYDGEERRQTIRMRSLLMPKMTRNEGMVREGSIPNTSIKVNQQLCLAWISFKICFMLQICVCLSITDPLMSLPGKAFLRHTGMYQETIKPDMRKCVPP